jgi:serine/threonine protein kinase
VIEIFPSPRPFNKDYELLGLLGKGGMGSHVYQARQIKLDRIVALKVLDTMGDDEAEKRFYSEARAMKELNHNNLATVFDFGIQDDKLFIAMTFVNGKSLEEVIRKERTLPVENATYIALKVAMGLEHAHKQGITHRDIKPSNIMIMEDVEPCVIDFGISLTSGSQRLTSTGMTMGTPEYMSPEQCQNKNVTSQSDIYNLGIVFYEMLSGSPPFTGGASLAILNAHLKEKPASLRKKNPNVSPELERIINKCLEKSTANRYASFTEFIKDLRDIGNEAQGSGKKSTVLMDKLSKSERVIFLILCILPILLISLILLLAFKNPPPEKSLPSISYLNSESWVVQSAQPEISAAPIFDGDLSTAWIISKNSALKSNNGILITIRFAKPTLVSNIGIAIGNQSDWDNFQKYSKPKEIWIRHINSSVKEYKVNEQSSVKKVSLEDKLGVQYVSWTPMEVTEIMFEMKSVQSDIKTEDLAISEIRIFGMEL